MTASFNRRSGLALVLTLTLSLSLGGCISIFPKAKPVQMYRFTDATPAAAAQPGTALVTVFKGPTAFPSSQGGDHILTVTGDQTAYIGGMQWVSPASLMFDQALLKAFDTGPVRLVERGEPLAAASTLRLDVRAFEARYPGPTVMIQIRGTLVRNSDRTIIAEKMFEASTPASDNRQGPIVAAFDTGVAKVIGDIRNWTAASAPAK